ncbi:MAG: cupin domain-containing protein, partial [Verrucomicrobiae bacterium]|nr:cupin domain-containing protein [Verrucomicrobiae bacterium]
MNGKFIVASEIVRDRLDWGEMGWISRPATTQARNICEIAVTLEPGFGHNFHKHPRQEEVIHVLAGEIEQWLGTQKRTLKPGDAVFIGPDLVHASFNTGQQTAKLLVVLSPCVGEGGYELADVAGEAPWN